LSKVSNETGLEISTVSTFNPEDVDMKSSAFNSGVCPFLLCTAVTSEALFEITDNSELTAIK